MSNVVKFDRKRKKDEAAGRSRSQFWTPERLAWPLFLAVALAIYLIRSSGILA